MGIDEAAKPTIAELLGRSSIPVWAYRMPEDPTQMQIYLEDVLDEHWPVSLGVMPSDSQDLAGSVRERLLELFPGCTIPPVVVHR